MSKQRHPYLGQAGKYERKMVRLLRDLVAIPSESTEEKAVIARIRREMNRSEEDYVELCIHDSSRPADCYDENKFPFPYTNNDASYAAWRLDETPTSDKIYDQTISFHHVQEVKNCSGTKNFYLDGQLKRVPGNSIDEVLAFRPHQDTKLVATFFPD